MTCLKPIGRWLIGFLFGTLLVAVTSPWFVRSYVGRVLDPVRNVITYPAGATYCWRSEGYATTLIGPHGMPGQVSLADEDQVWRIGLYGDSQVEGVAVDDTRKLFAMLQHRLPGAHVYPFARSGETAADWLPQMTQVETGLDVNAHVIVIVDVEDLITIDSQPISIDVSSMHLPNQVERVPDFVVHAASRLFRDSATGGLRHLRVHVGPVDEDLATPGMSASPPPAIAMGQSGENQEWLSSLKAATDQPLLIVFAPRVPEISNGRIRQDHRAAIVRRDVQAQLTNHGVQWIDVEDDFVEAASIGDWPHGFHNGQIGAGHLNVTGYAILADKIADFVDASWSPSSTKHQRE